MAPKFQTFPYNIDKIFCKDSSKNPDLKLLEFYGRSFLKPTLSKISREKSFFKS